MKKSTAIRSAKPFMEGLPYIQQFHGKSIVVKYGGSTMNTAELKLDFCQDIVFMKSVGLQPVIVHGGGPQISRDIQAAGLVTKFVHGLRVTDRQTMDIVENVMINEINQELVGLIQSVGGNAYGLGGQLQNGRFIHATKLQTEMLDPETNSAVEYGFVGEVKKIDISLLDFDSPESAIPVVAPVGVDEFNQSYNINADTVAGAIAESIKAEKLVILTNMPGILDEKGKLLSYLTASQLDELIDSEVIKGGMLPKARCAQHALYAGVHAVQIIDGRLPHSALLEIFTDEGVGTMISSD